jgi:hypothetical protein
MQKIDEAKVNLTKAPLFPQLGTIFAEPKHQLHI